jgi:hypothetical protein
MTKLLLLTLTALCIIAHTGCMSDSQSKDLANSYSEFVNQERYMPLQVWDFGTNGCGTITYSGLVSMRVYAPLDKLSLMPEQPGALREAVDGVVRVSGIAAAAYGVHELSNMKKTTTINNNPAP